MARGPLVLPAVLRRISPAAFRRKGRPIRIGLIGSGEMGTDIVTQCDQMTGITVAAIAEINIDAAKKALRIAGRPPESFAVADSEGCL